MCRNKQRRRQQNENEERKKKDNFLFLDSLGVWGFSCPRIMSVAYIICVPCVAIHTYSSLTRGRFRDIMLRKTADRASKVGLASLVDSIARNSTSVQGRPALVPSFAGLRGPSVFISRATRWEFCLRMGESENLDAEIHVLIVKVNIFDR